MKLKKWLDVGVVLLLMQLAGCERSIVDKEDLASKSARIGGDSTSIQQPSQKELKIWGQKDSILVGHETPYQLLNGKNGTKEWSVQPESATIISLGDSARISFVQKGTYVITVRDVTNNETAKLEVSVKEKNAPPVSYAQAIFEDDQIVITPVAAKDSISHLDFRIATTKDYNCKNNVLNISRSLPNYEALEIVDVNVSGAWYERTCEPGSKPAERTILMYIVGEQSFTKKIEIIFQGKTYSGSYTWNGKNHKIDWPYDSGVIFKTKTL